MLPVAVAVSVVIAVITAFIVKRIITDSNNEKDLAIHVQSAPTTVNDFESLARSRLPEAYWSYLSCGAGEEQTHHENIAAYNRYVIRPRYLRDVSSVDMRVTLFGDKMTFPIGIAPVQGHSTRNELLLSKACAELGALMVFSSTGSVKMEEIVKDSEMKEWGSIWYNMVVGTSIELFREHISRAEESGYRALVVTIDLPLSGTLKKSVTSQALANTKFPNYNIFDIKIMYKFYNNSLTVPSMTWEKIDAIRSLTHLPIILKGIMTAEDATEAVKHNVHGIIVSNHGGRQLDGVPATIDVLSEVVSTVDNKVDVFLDGGIRKGTDILKALALGAKAVFIGRPAVWGVEYNGFEGVKDVLTILRDELKLAMQLSGCANLNDIRNNNVVVHESHYRNGCHGKPHV